MDQRSRGPLTLKRITNKPEMPADKFFRLLECDISVLEDTVTVYTLPDGLLFEWDQKDPGHKRLISKKDDFSAIAVINDGNLEILD